MIIAENSKNTYDPNTPEWQLFENAIGALRLERAYIADHERYLKLAKEAREKHERYSVALKKLIG